MVRIATLTILFLMMVKPAAANDMMEYLKRAYAWREVSALCLNKAPEYQEDWSLMVQLHDKQIMLWQQNIRDELKASMAPEGRASMWFDQLDNLAKVWAPNQVKGMECNKADLEFLANRMTQDPMFFTAMELIRLEKGGR
ncbi:hypothetical protein [Shewanella sp.]|uniref:hypothetical protein n=1 Tax=Shewanella sp. TaxID=50422 RepID=UPI003561810E